ncbi:MAG: hypothetical protein RHS_0271 [Robinsoniella sp. RHS]|uniref:hypothetical protein n=1 Tax=Robinsoniella sp. RHS TaxID=1504536 RepID=UPI00064AF21F|nr:MAG: hypothetical protein RHS_0271 [Robinsoniella sp. RHS]
METQGLWSNNVPRQFDSEDHLYERIEEMLDMIDISNKYSTIYYKSSTLYSQEINNTIFVEWLYDYSCCELRDLKKELMIKIEKAIELDDDQYMIERESIQIYDKLKKIFLVSLIKENDFCVWTTNDYYDIKRRFLLHYDSKDDFLNNVGECYQHIYFENTIKRSLNSLNNTFNNLKYEIVNHLKMLDEYYEMFLKHRSLGTDNRMLSNDFSEFSGIECSPQASRSKTRELTRTFYSDIVKENITLCCELHTKFKNYNRDREKQDRIYFHPGVLGVHDGKIIVIHIGSHI